MLDAWKGLFGSKKFWMTILGTIVVSSASQLGLPIEITIYLGGLFGVGVAGQGLADIGKEKAKIEQGK